MNCIFRGLLRLLDLMVSIIMGLIVLVIGLPIAVVFVAIIWLISKA